MVVGFRSKLLAIHVRCISDCFNVLLMRHAMRESRHQFIDGSASLQGVCSNHEWRYHQLLRIPLELRLAGLKVERKGVRTYNFGSVVDVSC